MSDTPTLEEQVRTLTQRLEDLREHVLNPPEPPKPHWLKGLFSWDMAKNFMFVAGVPAGLLALYTLIDEQFIRYEEIDRNTRLPAALAQLEELQSYNAQVFTLQFQQEQEAAFALIDAKRGQVERWIKGVLAFWTDYPDELTVYERTALAEGLMTHELTADALAVVTSIDQSGMSEIQQGDLDLLRARILFSRGSGQNPEAARDALRDAMAHADAVVDPGVSMGLMEKYASVRLLNELWLGTPCDDVTVFAGFLTDMMEDGTAPSSADAVRHITYDVMAAYDRQCGPS